MKTYIQLNLTVFPVEPWTDILVAELGELKYDSFLITDDGCQAFVIEQDFNQDALTNLVSDYKDCISAHSTKKVEEENWNAIWEKNFDPIFVDNTCVVRASFHDTSKKHEFDIIIDPKMSFGTGHHQTTYLMISELLKPCKLL